MNNNREERIAKNMIEKYFPKLCINGKFIIADELKDENNKSPDLQNEIDDIGIEVTMAESQKELEIMNIAKKKKNNNDFLKIKTGNSGIIPILAPDGTRLLIEEVHNTNVEYDKKIQLLKNAINKKLQKLNKTKNRKYFSSNGLCILSSIPLDDEKINEVYKKMYDTQMEYLNNNKNDKIFNFIILSAQAVPNLICYFDMKNKIYNKIKEINS